MKVLAILGAPNGANGELSNIALQRCEKAISALNASSYDGVVVTGGFGAHFNTSRHPHYEYQKRYLINHGVPKNKIIHAISSSHTIEDLDGIVLFGKAIEASQIDIVTSDFHVARVSVIFDLMLSKHGYTCCLDFAVARSSADVTEVKRLLQHESNSMSWVEELEKNLL